PVHYLVWDKYAGRPLQGRLQNRLDAVIYFERGGHEPWQAGRSAVSLLDKHPARVARAELDELGGDHATPKPVGLMMDLIELVTKPGDIVLDPFAGSG